MTTSELALPEDPSRAVAFIIEQYRNGYYPYYQVERKHFYWDRRDYRTVIWFTPQVLAKSRKMLSKIPVPYIVEENQRVEQVLTLLADEQIKENSWVHGEIADLYRLLARYGYLKTFEAVGPDGFAGAVLGIDLPRIFIVETMVNILPDGSKAALCSLVNKYAELGYRLIDVQSPHKKDHPCARLFEKTISITAYLDLLKKSVIS